MSVGDIQYRCELFGLTYIRHHQYECGDILVIGFNPVKNKTDSFILRKGLK